MLADRPAWRVLVRFFGAVGNFVLLGRSFRPRQEIGTPSALVQRCRSHFASSIQTRIHRAVTKWQSGTRQKIQPTLKGSLQCFTGQPFFSSSL